MTDQEFEKEIVDLFCDVGIALRLSFRSNDESLVRRTWRALGKRIIKLAKENDRG